MADAAPHPYGPIDSFDFKAHDAKHTDSIQNWITLSMWPKDGPCLMLGLWFPDTHDAKQADEYYAKARQIAELLSDNVKTVSFQTV